MLIWHIGLICRDFIYLSAGAVEWQPLKVSLLLVLLIFGSLFIFINIFVSFHMDMLLFWWTFLWLPYFYLSSYRILGLGGSRLWTWAYSPIVFSFVSVDFHVLVVEITNCTYPLVGSTIWPAYLILHMCRTREYKNFVLTYAFLWENRTL